MTTEHHVTSSAEEAGARRRGERKPIPSAAVALCIAALVAPLLTTLALRSAPEAIQLVLWLLVLIPVFLLAYYRGWPGVGTALAAGVAAMGVSVAAISIVRDRMPPLGALLAVAVLLLSIGAAVGWLAEMLHRGRERAEALALTDELTGIPNRRHLRLVLEHDFAAAQRRGRPLTVAMFDLDRFKIYNDDYGHAAGDTALRHFARMLQSRTRRMELSGRYGGEEFLTILCDAETDDAAAFADRVRRGTANLELPHGAISVSVGVASFTPGMDSPDELIDAADRALYRAKAAGGATVCVAETPPLTGSPSA